MKCLWCDWPATYWHESEMADGKDYACRLHIPNAQWIKIEPETDPVDVSEYINIRIMKVKYNGKYTHWEVDVRSNPNTAEMSGTAPTLWGVTDMVSEHLWDIAQEDSWFQFDANARDK